MKVKLSPSGSDEPVADTVNCPPPVTVETAELATATGALLLAPPPPVFVDGGGVGVDEEPPPPPPQETRSDAPNKQATDTREIKGKNKFPQVVLRVFSMT